MTTAQLGDRVRIQYIRLPEQGVAPDETPDQKVLEFTVGGKEVLPGLSLGVVGMTPGDHKRLTLQPQDAYGSVQDDRIKQIPRRRFPKQLVLRVGKRLAAINPGSGRRWRVRIVEIKPDAVVVDGNHPLAGKVAAFDVDLLSLDSSANANQSQVQADAGGEG